MAHSLQIDCSLLLNLYTLKANMSVRFVYENGKGEAVDESGNMHFEMDIDTEAYPIDYITNYDEHFDCKLPEKTKEKPHNEKRSLHEKPNKKKMKMKSVHTGNMVMLSKNNCFFFLVYEKAMTPGQAAKQLEVNRRTAYNWVKKDQENPTDILELNNGKKVGRPSILNEVHKKDLINFYDDKPICCS